MRSTNYVDTIEYKKREMEKGGVEYVHTCTSHGHYEKNAASLCEKLDHMSMSKRKITCIWASITQAKIFYNVLYVRIAFSQACAM